MKIVNLPSGSMGPNKRTVVTNPFPGKRVLVQLEIQKNGMWGEPGLPMTHHSEAWGVYASQYNDGDIVVQTYMSGVYNNSHHSGNPFNYNGGDYVVWPSNTPARLKIWKLS